MPGSPGFVGLSTSIVSGNELDIASLEDRSSDPSPTLRIAHVPTPGVDVAEPTRWALMAPGVALGVGYRRLRARRGAWRRARPRPWGRIVLARGCVGEPGPR